MRGVVLRTWFAVTVAIAAIGMPAYAQTAPSQPSTPSPSPTIPFAGISEELNAINQQLDAATTRALQLEGEIASLDADSRALDERIAVTTARIVEQTALVDAAEARLSVARERYRKRLVEVYKHGGFDPLALLLSSESLTELVTRAAILTRITESDSQIVSDLNIALADARYQKASLDELQQQDRALKTAQEERRTALTSLLAEQDALVAQLSEDAREALLQARRLNAETRQQWRLASIPLDVEIPRATAVVDTHPGVEYACSAYMPRSYRSTLEVFPAVCSWYGPGFNGRGTASGQIFNENDFTCASRTLPFGTVLALSRGNRHIIVYVNDRGPYIAGRDLDLSKAAASALGFGGVATVQVEIVLPAQ